MNKCAFGVLNFNFLLYTRSLFAAGFLGGYYLMSLFVFSIAPFCHEVKICDLCSEVSCLYISNTKMINLREYSKGLFFISCWHRSSRLRAPTARQTLGIFHRLEPMRKRLVCCTSILKAHDYVGSKRKSNRYFPWHYAFFLWE